MTKVSIIITTYNRADLIPRAINSILTQTFQDFEVLIVDDASSDNTRDVVKSISDKRIIYVKKAENGGEASARNVGLRMAQGEYIAFQDSDDESLPTRIQLQVELLDASDTKVGIVYTDMYRVSEDGKSQLFRSPHLSSDDQALYPASLGYTMKNIGIGTSMIRKKAALDAGFFDEELDYCVDLEYFIRMSKRYRFAHIQEPLLKYYEAEPDITKIARIAAARMKILTKYYDEVKNDKALLGDHLFFIGNDLCYSGNMSEGRRYLYESLKVNPAGFRNLVALAGSCLGPLGYRSLVDLKNRITG